MGARKSLANVFLAAGSVAAFFLLFEGALRLTLYRFSSYPVSPGPGSVYVIETPEFKTTGRTNSLNMREREIPPKRPGEFRVLCLGDSFTFGLGVDVEDAYPRVLERILREGGRDAFVVNGGTGGAATEALAFLREKGFGFEPDHVVVQVYIGNDFYDGLRHLPDAGASARLAVPETSGPSPFSRFKASLKSSAAADFLWRRLIQIPVVDEWLYRENLRYDNRGIFLREYPDLENRLVPVELGALKSIAAACEEKGAGLTILVVPTKQQLFMRRHLDNEKYDYRKPNRVLAGFCAEANVACVDLLDAYERMPDRAVRELYYVQDRHWTAKGNRHAAEVLSASLRGSPA